MDTVGGAIFGYCSTGRRRIASAPASMMTMAMTQAKTGRSMKNLDMRGGDGAFGHALLHAGAHEQAGQQLLVRVGEDRPQLDGAGPRIDRHVGELKLPALAGQGALRVEDPKVAARAFMGMVTGNILMRRLILPQHPCPVGDVDRYVRDAVALFLSGAKAP
ncbi:TetR/AcrR family transcriptional regulator C-terminal domain-containing protein [Azospirillum sp. sgz302134]